MIRHALPGFGNNWLVLMKTTALVSVIGLHDRVFRASQAGGATRQPFWFFLAARAGGMSGFTRLRRITLPSALRRGLPAYSNEVIFMLHGTVLAGVITIVDLFGAAKIVNSRYFVPFESFIAAGFFYLCLTFIIVYLFKLVERKWHAHLRPRRA